MRSLSMLPLAASPWQLWQRRSSHRLELISICGRVKVPSTELHTVYHFSVCGRKEAVSLRTGMTALNLGLISKTVASPSDMILVSSL